MDPSSSRDGVFKVRRNNGNISIESIRDDGASLNQKLMDTLDDRVLELYIDSDTDTFDLSFISRCPNLEEFVLRMSSKDFTQIDLSPLKKADIKEAISLYFNGVDASFLEGIDMSFLAEVNVPLSFTVSAQGSRLHAIRKPSENTRLLFSTSTSAAFFYKVLNEVLPDDITGLDIKLPSVPIDLSVLSEFTHLTDLKLDISHHVGEMDLRVLERMPLKELHLVHNDDLLSLDLSFLREMKDLEVLTIAGALGATGGLDFSPVSGCCSLKQFTMNEDHMAFIDLTPLSRCMNLKELVIRGNSSVSLKLTMPDLSRHMDMHTIEVHVDSLKDTDNTSTIDLGGLAGCQSLHVIDMRLNNIIGELDLSPLATCTGLRHLDLSECHNLKELDLTPLGSLPSLEYLYLSHSCPYDRIDLTPLGTCESLKRLYIENDTNKSQDWSKYTYEVHKLDITSLFRLSELEYVLLFKDVRGDAGIDPAWPSSESRPEEHLDYYYKYLRPRRTIRQWLEQGVKSSFTKVTSLPTTLLVEESGPEAQVYFGYPSMNFYGVSSQRPPDYHDEEDWRRRIEFFVNASPLTPKLLADSSKVPKSERNPAWAKAYDIEWY